MRIFRIATLIVGMTSCSLLANKVRAQCDSWQYFGDPEKNISGDVHAFATLNGELIVAGDLFGGNVQCWTGQTWERLGDGIYDSHEIYSLCIYHDHLYAGGLFDDEKGQVLNGIARWDGTTWQPVGTEIGTSVNGLTIYEDKLVAMGSLKIDGDISNVALWDETRWLPIATHFSGTPNAYIKCITAYAGELVVAGRFDAVDNHPAKNIAAWNGREWHALKNGLSGPNQYASVLSLAVYADELYAGMNFFDIGSSPANIVWRWNGSEWRTAGGSFQMPYDNSTSVNSMLVFHGELIAAGEFVRVEGRLAYGIARWNGLRWREMGAGLGLSVRAMTVYEGNLITGHVNDEFHRWHDPPGECLGACCYQSQCSLTTFDQCEAAGGIYRGSGVPCNQIACEGECQTWQPLNQNLYWDDKYGYIGAFTRYDQKLIAAGRVMIMGGGPDWLNVVSWDGQRWKPVGSGMVGFTPYAAVSEGVNLYVARDRVARFNGRAWEFLGDPFDGYVEALAIYHDELIAAGRFTTSGQSTSLNNIARWDGQAWQPMGGGVSGGTSPKVYCLATFSDDLIVGGEFDTAGGPAANSIAAWNGEVWSPLGSGVAGLYAGVETLVVFNGLLVVGGEFTSAGGQMALNVAGWNGSTWQASFGAIGGPKLGYPSAMAVFHDNLLASGGWGDGGQNTVRRWNDALGIWQPLAPPALYGNAQVLLATDHEVFAGGYGLRYTDSPHIERIAHWTACLDPCRTDLNADGAINADDLMTVINAWGACANPSNCPPDLQPPNGDGVVYIDDLLRVLMEWGPCP